MPRRYQHNKGYTRI